MQFGVQLGSSSPSVTGFPADVLDSKNEFTEQSCCYFFLIIFIAGANRKIGELNGLSGTPNKWVFNFLKIEAVHNLGTVLTFVICNPSN
jgi:hypothetical protein